MAPPKVVSISYGQDEFTATPAYARRQCNEYGKLGLMGTTVLYGSGDDGVAGSNNTCLGPSLGPRGQWDPWLCLRMSHGSISL
jgi:tripeptidyl-peptidase-1